MCSRLEKYPTDRSDRAPKVVLIMFGQHHNHCHFTSTYASLVEERARRHLDTYVWTQTDSHWLERNKSGHVERRQ